LKALPPSTRRGVAGRASYPRSGSGASFDVRFWPIGTPMFNFSIPAALKACIDQIVRVRVTVSAGNVGLLTGKKAAIILASGDFSQGSPVERYNQASSYLRQLLGWIGISDIEIILACRARSGGMGETAVEQFVAAVQLAAAA
jgi:FMN-dependent NADH-azoreductase